MIINWYSKLFNSVCASMNSFFFFTFFVIFCASWRRFSFLTSRWSKLSKRKKEIKNWRFSNVRPIACVFGTMWFLRLCVRSIELRIHALIRCASTYHMTIRRRITARHINERHSECLRLRIYHVVSKRSTSEINESWLPQSYKPAILSYLNWASKFSIHVVSSGHSIVDLRMCSTSNKSKTKQIERIQMFYWKLTPNAVCLIIPVP